MKPATDRDLRNNFAQLSKLREKGENSEIAKRIRPSGCFFSKPKDLEELSLKGRASGTSAPMTKARKKRIYRKALKDT